MVLKVRPEWLAFGRGPKEEEGARETPVTYHADSMDPALLGTCALLFFEELARLAGPIPPAAKLGAALAEIYGQCEREGKQPTPELVASFVRVMMA